MWIAAVSICGVDPEWQGESSMTHMDALPLKPWPQNVLPRTDLAFRAAFLCATVLVGHLNQVHCVHFMAKCVTNSQQILASSAKHKGGSHSGQYKHPMASLTAEVGIV